MPNWTKNAADFAVGMMENGKYGTSCSDISKPALDELGNPHSLEFSKTGGGIAVEFDDG